MSEPFRLRYVNQVVGLFILAVLCTLVLFTLYLIRGKELLAKVNDYYLELDHNELAGLREGTEVVLLGQSVGRISDIQFVPGTNRLRVTLAIKDHYRQEIFIDSVIALRRKFGVGEPYLEVMRGPRSTLPMPISDAGAAELPLTFQPDEDKIAQVQISIANVEDQMVPTLKTIDTTFRNIDKQLDASAVPAMDRVGEAAVTVDRSVRNVEPHVISVLDGMEKSTARFDESMVQIVAIIDETAVETRDALDKIRSAAAQVTESTQAIEAQSTATMSQLQRSAEDLQRLVNESREITDALRAETADLPGTVDRINGTFYTAQQVVEALRRHWLLRRYVDQQNSTRQTPPAAVR